MSAYAICEKYLPQQPWMYGADELTDRSEKISGQRNRPREPSPHRRRVALHLHRHRQVRGKAACAALPPPSSSRRGRPQGHDHWRKGEKLKNASAPRPVSSWKSCSMPRCFWSCGSRCARAGLTTMPACAPSVTSKQFYPAVPRPPSMRPRRLPSVLPPTRRPPSPVMRASIRRFLDQPAGLSCTATTGAKPA